MPTATFVVDPASKEKSLGILEWLWLANPPAAASRIDLSWTDKTYAGMTASLDGTQLGTVRDPMTLAQGANFRLPDRSNLRVTLRGNHLTVTRNGRPLQPVRRPEAAVHEATDTLYLVALWYGIPGLIFFFMHNKDLGLGGLNLLIGIAFAGLAHWSRQSSKAFGVAILAMLIHFFASFGVFKAAQAREVAESITYGSDTFPVMLAEGAAMGSFMVLWGAGAYVLRGLFASGHIPTPAAPAVELPASHS